MAKADDPLEEFSGIARNKVVLQTIHGSKGLEYMGVFLPALEKGILPQWKENQREARRLFYVAITRAKREVNLMWSGFWHTNEGKLKQDGPSPLVRELFSRLYPE